jgi:hypothetical protein
MCQMRKEEGFKFCLNTKNIGTLPLNLAYPECLNVQSPIGLPYLFRTLCIKCQVLALHNEI